MIHFICALMCEARSLIAHYQLKYSADSKSFPLYISPDKQISLTISGVGKINAAAATAFTHAFLQSEKHHIWLNVGKREIFNILLNHINSLETRLQALENADD